MKTSIPSTKDAIFFFTERPPFWTPLLIRFVATSQRRNLDEEARKIKECPQVGQRRSAVNVYGKDQENNPFLVKFMGHFNSLWLVRSSEISYLNKMTGYFVLCCSLAGNTESSFRGRPIGPY